MKILTAKKGQLTLEISLLVVIVVTALACMSGYIKRGVQGRFKRGADAICSRQYEPGSTTILGR